jgi:hypothetical protein
MVYPALLPLMRTPRAASSRLNWRPPADLNLLVRFARKTKSGFCACAITFRLASTSIILWDLLFIVYDKRVETLIQTSKVLPGRYKGHCIIKCSLYLRIWMNKSLSIVAHECLLRNAYVNHAWFLVYLRLWVHRDWLLSSLLRGHLGSSIWRHFAETHARANTATRRHVQEGLNVVSCIDQPWEIVRAVMGS